MTVTSFLNYKEYQGDGVAKTFAIPFLLLNHDDLAVYVDSKLISGNYSLAGVGSPISSITFLEAPKGKVLLQRSIALLRDTDYQENGDLLADTLNRDFDRIYLAMQGTAQNTSQALRVVDPEGVNALPLREVRANKLLSFDSQGQPSLSTIDSESALGLASALADTTENQKGAGLVGFNDSLIYPNDTLGYAIQNIDQIAMFTTQWWADRKSIPQGYVVADGQELPHGLYPDVAKALKNGQMPQVTNEIWLSDPTKRGCYVADTGNNTFRLPDYNGMQSSSVGSLFVRGGNGDVTDGTVQGDAIRDITGAISFRGASDGSRNLGFSSNSKFSGALAKGTQYSGSVYSEVNSSAWSAFNSLEFNASNIVPTAEENRPVNVTGCWIIRLFGTISNTSELDASKLADEYAVLSLRLNIVEAWKQEARFTIIYPNSGSASNLANVTINNRYIMDNPFAGCQVMVLAEIYNNSIWAATGFIAAINNSVFGGYGTSANYISESDKIIVQTGNAAVLTQSIHTGGGHGSTDIPTSALCRVKVWRVD